MLHEDLYLLRRKMGRLVPYSIQMKILDHQKMLRETQATARSLSCGAHLPSFQLYDDCGKEYNADSLFEGQNKYLFLFFRGHWCPYAQLVASTYCAMFSPQKYPNIKVVAVTPEVKPIARSSYGRFCSDLLFLHDPEAKFIASLGLTYAVPADLYTIYWKMGLDVRHMYHNNPLYWPLPAVYLVDGAGKAQYVYVGEDTSRWPNPEEVMALL